MSRPELCGIEKEYEILNSAVQRMKSAKGRAYTESFMACFSLRQITEVLALYSDDEIHLHNKKQIEKLINIVIRAIFFLSEESKEEVHKDVEDVMTRIWSTRN